MHSDLAYRILQGRFEVHFCIAKVLQTKDENSIIMPNIWQSTHMLLDAYIFTVRQVPLNHERFCKELPALYVPTIGTVVFTNIGVRKKYSCHERFPDHLVQNEDRLFL